MVAVGAFGVWLAFQLENKDIARVCRRDFQRQGTDRPSTVESEFGPLHKVGETRNDEVLLTAQAAWPSHCEDPAATLLFSKKGDLYQVWALRGGP